MPVVGPLLPAADFLPAFLGAAGVSALVAILSARLSGATYELERLAGTVRRFDTGTVEATDEPSD